MKYLYLIILLICGLILNFSSYAFAQKLLEPIPASAYEQDFKTLVKGGLNRVIIPPVPTFSPDGNYIAYVSPLNKNVKVMELETREVISELKDPGFRNSIYPVTVVFTPSGEYIAILNYVLEYEKIESLSHMATLWIWDFRKGNIIKTLELPLESLDPSKAGPLYIAFSPNNSYMAVSTGARTIKIWRTEDWSLISELRIDEPLPFSPDWISYLIFSRDSQYLVSRVGFHPVVWSLYEHNPCADIKVTDIVFDLISASVGGQGGSTVDAIVDIMGKMGGKIEDAVRDKVKPGKWNPKRLLTLSFDLSAGTLGLPMAFSSDGRYLIGSNGSGKGDLIAWGWNPEFWEIMNDNDCLLGIGVKLISGNILGAYENLEVLISSGRDLRAEYELFPAALEPAFALSPKENLLISLESKENFYHIVIWDIKDKKEVMRVRTEVKFPKFPRDSEVFAFPDGKRIAILMPSPFGIKIWEILE